jgi:phosphatidylglycerol:prolipoprotein diacylglycerol transferase
MLLVFWFLYRLAKRPQPGWLVFAWFLVLSGVERFLIEFLRLNPVWHLGLTAPQWIALGGIGVGAYLLTQTVLTPRPAVVGQAVKG